MMPSQIIFLGTAGDSFVIGKQQRTAAGIIIQHNETQLHLNPGPNATAKHASVDPAKTEVIIVTDNTLLHSHDANAVIDFITFGHFDRAGLLVAAKSAVKDQETKQARIHHDAQDAVQRTIIMGAGNKVEYNGIQIHGFQIKNSDLYAIGIKIVTDGFSLAYTNKTKYTAKLQEVCKGVEILLFDLSLIQLKKSEDGLSLGEAEKLISEVKPKVAIIASVGMDIVKEDILELTRNMQRATGIQIIAAHDGFAFDPTSYAVQLRQKRLIL